MTSASCELAWRGHLADEANETPYFISTTMGDKDLTHIEIPTRQEASSAEPPFQNVLIRYHFGVEPHMHLSIQGFWHPELLYPTGVSCLLSIEVPPEEERLLPEALRAPDPWQMLFSQIQPEPNELEQGGVYSPPYQRKVLFSLELEFQTANLHRWKPHIAIDPLILSGEADD